MLLFADKISAAIRKDLRRQAEGRGPSVAAFLRDVKLHSVALVIMDMCFSFAREAELEEHGLWHRHRSPKELREIDRLHRLLHPSTLCQGIYRAPDNTGGCDKEWCVAHVPVFYDSLKHNELKVVYDA